MVALTASAGVPQKKVKQYSCAHFDRNVLHHPAKSENLDKFFSKMDEVLLFGSRNVNIIQVGDSHIQADYFSHRLRVNFATMQPGLGGSRGCLFPCALANTYFNKNYLFEWGGSWNAGTNLRGTGSIELGVSGMAAWTSSPESWLKLTLNRGDVVKWQFNKLRVFGHCVGGDVNVYAEDGSSRATGKKTAYGWEIELSRDMESVTVHFSMPAGGTFVFSGMTPLSGKPSINYFSLGVGGASTFSWNHCSRFERELPGLEPDLAIISLGTNDGAVGPASFNAESFKKYYRWITDRIRNVAPDCAIILVPANDIYLRGVANSANNMVQKAIYDLAEDIGASVWDVYDIQGGLGNAVPWRDAGLAMSDLVHFTQTGYEFLADMMYNAMMKDYLGGAF